MGNINLDNFKVAKVDESGAVYYYYLFLKPKAHALSDLNVWQIMRSNVAGTEFKYAFGTSDSDTAWTARASQTFKDISQW